MKKTEGEVRKTGAIPIAVPNLPPEGASRHVHTGEVATHGKKTCKSCYGRGYVMVSKKPDGPSTEKACGCAVKRFLKANRTNLVIAPDECLWWLDGKEPKVIVYPQEMNS